MNKRKLYIVIFAASVLMFACSPKVISTKYYEQNKEVLDQIEESYAKLYNQKPFAIAFTDRYFQTVSVEFITDSLKYVYEFGPVEKRIKDSLSKYGHDVSATLELIRMMKSIRCTWVNNFDYYIDGAKKSLIFMSIKPASLNTLFSNKRYYILTYFQQQQYYDSEGRLLDSRKQRQIQRLNGEIFRRINDKVCYTISSNYR